MVIYTTSGSEKYIRAALAYRGEPERKVVVVKSTGGGGGAPSPSPTPTKEETKTYVSPGAYETIAEKYPELLPKVQPTEIKTGKKLTPIRASTGKIIGYYRTAPPPEEEPKYTTIKITKVPREVKPLTGIYSEIPPTPAGFPEGYKFTGEKIPYMAQGAFMGGVTFGEESRQARGAAPIVTKREATRLKEEGIPEIYYTPQAETPYAAIEEGTIISPNSSLVGFTPW